MKKEKAILSLRKLMLKEGFKQIFKRENHWNREVGSIDTGNSAVRMELW